MSSLSRGIGPGPIHCESSLLSESSMIVRAFSALLITLSVFSSGCGGRPVTGPWLKHERSYDFEGENVTVRMLTPDEMSNYVIKNYSADSVYKDEWADRLAADFPNLFPKQQSAVSIVAPVVIGLAVDAVKAELQKEASLYKAQFGARIYKSGYWEKFETKNGEWVGTARWAGFEVVRKTDKSKTAAFRAVFGIIPATEFDRDGQMAAKVAADARASAHAKAVADAKAAGRPEPAPDTRPFVPAADERLFVVKPLLLDVDRTRAKVFMTGSKVNINTVIRLEATWIDGQQGVRQEVVAAPEFEFKDLDLKGGDPIDPNNPKSPRRRVYINDLKDHIAGWFGGVPVSFDPKSKAPKGNGTFKLSAAVTEEDQSNAPEVIEAAVKYIDDNKDQIGK